MEGVAPQKAVVDRYNELALNYSDESADEITKLQDEIEAKGLWDLDSKVDLAMDALRCPADDAEVAKLSGGERRRVALCRLLLEQPDFSSSMSEPITSMPSGNVARGPSAQLSWRHPRSLPTTATSRQCHQLDTGARSRPRSPTRATIGRLGRSGNGSNRRVARKKPASGRSRASRNGSPRRRAHGKPSQRHATSATRTAQESRDKQTNTAQIVIPVAERLGQNVIDFENLKKGFGDNLLIDDLSFNLPPGGIVGVIGPNGAAKPRCSA